MHVGKIKTRKEGGGPGQVLGAVNKFEGTSKVISIEEERLLYSFVCWL